MNSNLKTVASDAPASEIDSQLGTLSDRLTYMQTLITSLENRLEPVLTPRGESGEIEGKSIQGDTLSPLSERLLNEAVYVSRLSDRLQSLLNNLAV